MAQRTNKQTNKVVAAALVVSVSVSWLPVSCLADLVAYHWWQHTNIAQIKRTLIIARLTEPQPALLVVVVVVVVIFELLSCEAELGWLERRLYSWPLIFNVRSQISPFEHHFVR